MAEIATPHRTLPIDVLVTQPLTPQNRSEVARWLEDHGVEVGVPANPDSAALLVRIPDGIVDAAYADRVVLVGREAAVIDHAHYKLWYEPIEEPTP